MNENELNKIMTVDEFIAQHTYTNYCEAILFKDGRIAYAVPSHTYALMRFMNKSKEELDKIMPVYAGVIHWIVSYTDYICLYTNLCIYHDMTDAQKETIQKLISNNIVDSPYYCSYTDEYERCDCFENHGMEELQELENRRKPNFYLK